MSDEQQRAMEPEAARKQFTEDQPADDTEGHGNRLKAKDDEQAGSETGTEALDDDDTEAHRASMYSDRDLKRDITPVSW